MVDSTGSGAVVDECAGGSAELVVEGDRGGEGEEALRDALSDAGECSCAVALQCQQVLAGPEDRLDALADRCEVGTRAGLVFAGGSEDRGVEFCHTSRERSSGVALVADHGLSTDAWGASEQFQCDLALILLGEVSASALGVPSGAKTACRRKPQKKREWELQYP